MSKTKGNYVAAATATGCTGVGVSIFSAAAAAPVVSVAVFSAGGGEILAFFFFLSIAGKSTIGQRFTDIRTMWRTCRDSTLDIIH